MNHYKIFVLFGIVFGFCSPLFGQVSTEQYAVIRTSPCIKKNTNISNPLRIIRREDIEDDLFNIQRKIVGKIAKAAYFFEVRPDGNFVLSPNESISITSTTNRKWLIAISTKTGEIFDLYGCEDAETNFINLIMSSNVKIETTFAAEQLSKLKYLVIEDLDLNNLILDELQLKYKVENYFSDKYEDKKASKISKTWLNKIGKVSGKEILGVRAKKINNFYETSYTFLFSENNNLFLGKTEMQIQNNGQYKLVSFKIN